MIAVVRPGRASNRRSWRTGRSPWGYAKVTSANATRPDSCAGATGRGGSVIDVVVSSTSTIRWALASARGMRMTMKTAVITAKRICMMYCRNAVRFPIGISPRSTSPAPNQRIATVDRFMIARSDGNASAKIRFTRSDVSVRSAFATSNRARSESTRMNALTTRTPVICSRST